ncbi:hypothetical protein [Neobacillus vireti]|uniref:Uncharacterized protein n=1 Tax=Neobacillus vireti LMG 21834 TaxID=1131730 RepID=A0AB94IL46_9BACI|nr:hypothetical protein [Neobacillus vireti]ETI67723.1 hypothetical protein BAVI_16187 [Neobacillus vireti LMG 21834]KLT19775.1 hypothetical protein AA980_04180 [Neobacillus vireti]
MSFWITICGLFFGLLLIIEELIYFSWNRYVYGPNLERKMKRKNRIKWLLALFKRKTVAEIHETNQKESPL